MPIHTALILPLLCLSRWCKCLTAKEWAITPKELAVWMVQLTHPSLWVMHYVCSQLIVCLSLSLRLLTKRCCLRSVQLKFRDLLLDNKEKTKPYKNQLCSAFNFFCELWKWWCEFLFQKKRWKTFYCMKLHKWLIRFVMDWFIIKGRVNQLNVELC